MRRLLLCCLTLISAVAAFAHPGVGIVMDSRGNVYYTDLEKVWKIAPDGQRSVAVPNVHTHELYIDSADRLYGEHLWYEGERTDKWGHRVWRRSPDGVIVDVVPPREGFRMDYSFVRDAVGNGYWAEKSGLHGPVPGGINSVDTIRRKAPDGKVSTMARYAFRNARWMTVTPAGVLYLIDGTDLMRVTQDGHVQVVTRNLSSHRLARPDISDSHMLMGLWPDRAGNIYVADYSHGEVKKVTPAGAVRVVTSSRLPWSPTGGVFAPNGDLYLLEYSVTNAARVRKVKKAELSN